MTVLIAHTKRRQMTKARAAKCCANECSRSAVTFFPSPGPMCNLHYQRWRKRGTLDCARPRPIYRHELANKRFGRLLVVAKAADGKWECACDCGSVARVSTANLVGNVTQSCGCWQRERTAQANAERKSPPDVALERAKSRLLALCIPEPNSGCWLWEGAITRASGYGRFGYPGEGTIFAHRAAFRLLVGSIPEGEVVCHRCDNPSCVNPGHLFTGTMRDNVHDSIGKGRAWFQK